MCGLFGIFGKDASLSKYELEEQFSIIRHRGPDGYGSIEFPECILGHTLLAIQDPGFATQPMTSISGKSVIVFNGEIYNFKDLRRRLNLTNLRTNSDTEVVLELIDRFSPEIIELFEGQFAFAFFNKIGKKLTLARDRFGEKPLFFSRKSEKIFFGSDPRSVRQMTNAKLNLDQEIVGHYQNYQYLPEGCTLFENVNQLLPGSYTTFDLEQREDCKRIVTAKSQDRSESDFKSIFSHSVQDCLVSDVPIGIALSGGIDSTMVLYEAIRINPEVKSFTVSLNESDTTFANEAASLFGSEHHEIKISNAELPDLIMYVLSNQPLPFGDSSIIPTYALAKYAGDQVKVLISGDGADEVLSGYKYYRKFGNAKSRNVRDYLEYSKKVVEAHGLRRLLGKKEFSRINRIKELEFILSRKSAIDLWQDDLGILDKLDMRRMGLDAAKIRKISRSSFSEFRDVQTVMEWDRNSYLPGDILWKSDTAGMMASLEIRTPFLNSQVVAWAQSITFSSDVSKQSLMRKEYSGIVPDHFFTRKKMGFGAPLIQWFEIPRVIELFNDYVKDRRSRLYDFIELPKRLNVSHLDPQIRWNLLALAIWLQNNA